MGTLLDQLLDLEKTPGARSYSEKAYNLDGFRAFLQSLGNPHRGLHFIHVAGTKGKGSTVALCESILRAHGFPTAMFTSPHLEHFGERFQFDGRAWTAEEFEARLESFADRLGPEQRRGFQGPHPYRTVFETLTAMALLAFHGRQEELRINGSGGRPLMVCWETGLGGRLDCTNVVDPLATVLTTIGMDHVALLGGTIERIAEEKAGILKAGCPAIVCRQEPAHAGPVLDVFREKAAAVGCPIVRAWNHNPVGEREGGGVWFRLPDGAEGECAMPLAGEFQRGNLEGALAACWYAARACGLTLDVEGVARGISQVIWPGRMEVHPVEGVGLVVLDGAHCPLSARALGREVKHLLAQRRQDRYTLLLGMQGEKDHRGFLSHLLEGSAPSLPSAVMTYRVPGSRGAPPETLVEAANALGIPATACEDPGEALSQALATGSPIVAAGSLYTLSRLRSLLGWAGRG